MNATHFEFELNDKIGGSERETTPKPSLCGASQKSAKKRKERDMVPSAIAHSGSAERVCLNSARYGKVKGRYPGRRSQREWRTTYASAPKSHHLRERVGPKLITYKARIENVPILEVLVDVWSKKGMCSQLNGLQVGGGESQNWLS